VVKSMENRRLAAVLIADIAGYTRLVEQDTDATVAARKAVRAEVIEPRVAEFSGRIVKLTGDVFWPSLHPFRTRSPVPLPCKKGWRTDTSIKHNGRGV